MAHHTTVCLIGWPPSRNGTRRWSRAARARSRAGRHTGARSRDIHEVRTGEIDMQPAPTATLLPQDRPPYRSPEVLPDGRVAFRLWAPLAHEVTVSGTFRYYERGPWPEQ